MRWTMAHTASEGSWMSGRAIAKYETMTKTARVKSKDGRTVTEPEPASPPAG